MSHVRFQKKYQIWVLGNLPLQANKGCSFLFQILEPQEIWGQLALPLDSFYVSCLGIIMKLLLNSCFLSLVLLSICVCGTSVWLKTPLFSKSAHTCPTPGRSSVSTFTIQISDLSAFGDWTSVSRPWWFLIQAKTLYVKPRTENIQYSRGRVCPGGMESVREDQRAGHRASAMGWLESRACLCPSFPGLLW